MLRTTIAGLLGAAGLASAFVLASPSNASPAPLPKQADGLGAIALTGHQAQRIVWLDVDRPEKAKVIAKVHGLSDDGRLVGIDYRVQDGRLYCVGDSGGIYTLRPFTGVAKKVSQLSVPLEGASFGVDFNPAADRLRIVSDTGQNLRHDVNAAGATTVDIGLTYPPATTPAAGITAAAYTNNDLAASTATTLFDIDTALDQVAIQAPANSGQLSPTGFTGVDADDAGFDIYSHLNRSGTTTSGVGLATLQVDGVAGLYSVDLLTGDADRIGSFKPSHRVVDIAIPLDQD